MPDAERPLDFRAAVLRPPAFFAALLRPPAFLAAPLRAPAFFAPVFRPPDFFAAPLRAPVIEPHCNRPSTNSQSLRDSMAGVLRRVARSELKQIDARVTSEIGKLPGGPVGVALGAEYREESMAGGSSPLEQVGGVLNRSSVSVDASRTDLAVFGELALPFTRFLEGQAALRYDHYSDFGSAITPKLGLKLKPATDWLARATWGRGFKAPTLPEVTPSISFVPFSVADPKTGVVSRIADSITGNPGLQPEKTRTFTAGVVYEPGSHFSVGVDFYDIRWSNRVSYEPLSSIVANPSDPRVYRDPASGVIVAVQQSWINQAQASTQGMDIDVRYAVSTGHGRFASRLAATYVASFEMDGQEYAGTDGSYIISNVSAVPRWKGQWSMNWESGPWTSQLTLNYLHHYWRVTSATLAPGFFKPGTAALIPQTGQAEARSPSFTTFDLYVRYNVTRTLSVSLSAVNLTDEAPPFDPFFNPYFYDASVGFDIRGRIVRIGAQYSF